jgi:hypothetical protein
MRLLGIFVLAGTMVACGGNTESSKSGLEQVEAESRAKAAENGAIDCAIAGSTDFKGNCQVEREISGGELVLTIRHEDGGFRRLRVLKDGRGVVAADGAEPWAETATVCPRQSKSRISPSHFDFQIG